MFEFKIANNDNEKAAVYRFRYRVGIKKYGLKQRYANHQDMTVIEPLDDMADLNMCLSSGVLIATSRTSYAINNNIQFYKDIYGIHDEVDKDPEKIVIVSKLIVDKTLENNENQDGKKPMSCAIKFMCNQFESALRKGIKVTYLDCKQKSSLNQYYTRLGFKLHKTGVAHPDTGTVNVYKLEMDDINHISSVGSPLKDVYLNTISEFAK